MAEIKKKCWPEWFEKFLSGERKFELRLADFKLKAGDILTFEEYNPEKKDYTGRKISFTCKRVEHSAQNPLQFYNIEDVKKNGFWIIDLEKCESEREIRFCPKCKSENVELTTTFFMGAKYPAPHLGMNKCKDCSYEAPAFPVKTKKIKKES